MLQVASFDEVLSNTLSLTTILDVLVLKLELLLLEFLHEHDFIEFISCEFLSIKSLFCSRNNLTKEVRERTSRLCLLSLDSIVSICIFFLSRAV